MTAMAWFGHAVFRSACSHIERLQCLDQDSTHGTTRGTIPVVWIALAVAIIIVGVDILTRAERLEMYQRHRLFLLVGHML